MVKVNRRLNSRLCGHCTPVQAPPGTQIQPASGADERSGLAQDWDDKQSDEGDPIVSRASTPQQRLLLYHEIPEWQQENEYILSGYRPTSNSITGSLEDLLYINNETVSTYTHLLGCILFLLLPCHFYTCIYTQYSDADYGDVLAVSIYLIGVAVCFALSATCHIVWNHSPGVAALGNTLDYLGILVLMWGASIPTIYYGFCCDPFLQRFYWTLMSVSALLCAVLTSHPIFKRPHFRSWRATLYASFGLSSILFILHGLVLHGHRLQSERMSLGWMAWMGGWNVFGAGVYAMRIPERWFPYRFDIYGASHQIFHLAVMVAACVHYAGLIEAFKIIRSGGSACE